MKGRNVPNDCGLGGGTTNSTPEGVKESKEDKQGSFKLFDRETISHYVHEPYPSKHKDFFTKIHRHSGYIKARDLPVDFEQIMNEMDALYPHFAEVNEFLRQRLRLYALQKQPVLHFGSNILLDGPAGVGKSSYLFELSQKFDTLFHTVDCARATNGFDLTGMSRKWNGGESGSLHDLLFNHECPNPIIMLDEVEKSETDSNHPILKTLYGLLEPNNARFFKDEFVQVPMDASLINWFGTCNDVNRLDGPIRDRFELLSVKAPTSDDLQSIIPILYTKMLKRHKLEEVFSKRLNIRVIEHIAMTDGISLRRINSALETALSSAAYRSNSKSKRSQRIRLKANDIPVIKAKNDEENHPIGFIWG